ncbi:MAG: acetate/propionate family kinase [Chthoniobacterales bacterium]
MAAVIVAKSISSHILTINGGSSSIKFALFEPNGAMKRILRGVIKRIGSSDALFAVQGSESFSRKLEISSYPAAAEVLMEWLEKQIGRGAIAAVGHRIVHGGPKYNAPQRITGEMMDDLRALSSFDPEHLPEELALIEAVFLRCPDPPQIACFDTAFHHDLPRVAQLLPIPRRYFEQGVRRYGFHGLSYAYLMEQLGPSGRVILAHLGSGASLAAVRDGKPVDTSMAFTPAAGFPMSTRSGDLDPGLIGYLAQTEQMTASQFQKMVNHESGLLGISEMSSDMRTLLEHEAKDERAAEAVTMFCYQVKKWIGGFAAALGGLDTLVFAGGMGENAPLVRARICEGLGFLGLELDEKQNAGNAGIISAKTSSVAVRVIRTDEELMIARSVLPFLRRKIEP